MIKHTFKYLLGFVVLAFLAGCAMQPSIEIGGFSIVDKNHKSFDFEAFINEIAKYDIVIIGEEHDSMQQHLAQSRVIWALAERKNINVVYEMISTEKQATLDNAKARKDIISPISLPEAINWDKKWDYQHYKHPIEASFYSRAGLSAGNISREEIQILYDGAEPIKGVLSTTNEVRARLKSMIEKTHSMKDDEMLNKLVEIQQYKDRRMADVLVHSKVSSMLIAGKYHAYKQIGVPLHIMDFKTPKSVAVVIFVSARDIPKPEEYDFLWKFDKK